MNIIWKRQTAFMKDLLDAYSEPKPAPTTIATMLKRMSDTGFIGYKSYGRSREYFALVKKQDYFSRHLKGMIKHFFDGSPTQFASFFATKTALKKSELEALKKIIEKEIEKR